MNMKAMILAASAALSLESAQPMHKAALPGSSRRSAARPIAATRLLPTDCMEAGSSPAFWPAIGAKVGGSFSIRRQAFSATN
jgi:hypothetical protein